MCARTSRLSSISRRISDPPPSTDSKANRISPTVDTTRDTTIDTTIDTAIDTQDTHRHPTSSPYRLFAKSRPNPEKANHIQRRFEFLGLRSTHLSFDILLSKSHLILNKTDSTDMILAKVAAAREVLNYLIDQYEITFEGCLFYCRSSIEPWLMRELLTCFDNKMQTRLDRAVMSLDLKQTKFLVDSQMIRERSRKKEKQPYYLSDKKSTILMILDALYLFVCNSGSIPLEDTPSAKLMLNYLILQKEDASQLIEGLNATLVPALDKLAKLAEDKELEIPDWCQHKIKSHENCVRRILGR